MNHTLMPSLKHRAAVIIAVTLWNHDDAKDLVSKFHVPSSFLIERPKEWQEVEDKITNNVQTLKLPELIKKELSYFVGAVGWQMLIWKEYHKHLLGGRYTKKNSSKLCWTPHGTVDKKRTAELLVRVDILDICERYKLACIYCLQEEIYTLWSQLSGKNLYGKDLSKIRMHEPTMVSFWSHYIEGEIAQLGNIMKQYCKDDNVTPFEFAFQHSADNGNEIATRYFLQKLTPEERERILVKTVGEVANKRYFVVEHTDLSKDQYNEVFCFLLLQMNEEQQKEMFEISALEVLECFLDWPWQCVFMEMAQRMWAFLPKEERLSFMRKEKVLVKV